MAWRKIGDTNNSLKLPKNLTSGLLVGNQSRGLSLLQFPQSRTILVSDTTAELGLSWKTVSAGVQRQTASLYLNQTQTISSSTFTYTKVQLNSVFFDPDNIADAQNGRITPTIAGYYLITARTSCTRTTTFINVFTQPCVYKNGVRALIGTCGFRSLSTYETRVYQNVLAGILWLNGSTDYVELYIYHYTSSYAMTLETEAQKNFLSVIGPLLE